MTLDAKIGILWIFWLWAARHISRADCPETNWDSLDIKSCMWNFQH